MDVGEWSNAIATILSVLGAMGALYTWRRSQLRHSDILSWGLDGISALQTLFLTLKSEEQGATCESRREMINDLAIRISVLTEQGRLYFKNRRNARGAMAKHGSHKFEAYQGTRPLILDKLLIGYEIAAAWENSSPKMRDDLLICLSAAEKEFVTLLQFEVGRSRVASARAGERGRRSPLEHSLRNIEELRSKVNS